MMLEVENLQAAYGASQVLFGVDLNGAPGEMVTLLGRNGMGKTTSIKTIMGMLPPLAGRVMLDGSELTRRPSFEVAQAGIGLVPEGRQIFPNLSVRENLVATAANRNRSVTPWTSKKCWRCSRSSALVSPAPGPTSPVGSSRCSPLRGR